MLQHYIKTAFRHLLKYKTQNLISILGLSVGILCFSICLYCSRFIYSVDQCFTNKERIANVNLYTPDGDIYSGIPANLIESLRQTPVDEAEDYTFVGYPRPRSYNVETPEGKELPYEDLYTMEVDSSYNKVFTPQIVQGSWETASHTPNSVILTRSLARKIFGNDESPIGKRMISTQRLSTSPSTTPRTGGISYTIQAVIEDIPLNTSLSFLHQIDMLTLNDSEGVLQFESNNNMTGGLGFALLRPSKTPTQLEARFRAMNLKHTMFKKENDVTASPFGKNFLEKSIAPYFAGITSVIGLLILLTGLLNFFQFLTGSYLNRSHEFGIRKATGSGDRQLFGLLFTQAVFISLIAFLFTFSMIEMLSPFLSFSLFNFTLLVERNLLLTQTTEYMAGILLLCLLLCLITVWRIKHISIQTGIRGSNPKRSRHPSITDKLPADINYLGGISGTGMYTEKGNRDSYIEVNIMNISSNFFEFMNIPILSGHTLETNEQMVADHKLAERMKKDLLGMTLYNYEDGYTVCGTCSDFIADTYNQSQGFIFLPCNFNEYVGHCYLKCKPGSVEEVKSFIEETLKESFPPSIQPRISTLLDDIHQEQAIENKMKGIIFFFSFVSLIITLLGVYSAITLDTERRQKEVAIRKVNGAGLKQIILLFARMYIYLLAFSAIIAFPICYVVFQLWKNMYIVFFNDGPLFWTSIFMGVAAITILTIIFRILKIAKTNPAEVIKNE